MMRNGSHKKALALGIIVLFIGMSITTSTGTIIEQTTLDNHPPGVPTINGPSGGTVGIRYDYELIAEDPDGDNLSYYIEWGDGTSDGWTDYQNSGEPIVLQHIWYTVDIFQIRCKAKDIYGAEGNWSEVNIPITKNKAINRTSRNIDDCDCKVDDDYNLVRLERLFNKIESLLDRVETCNKLMPILYKNNHEVI